MLRRVDAHAVLKSQEICLKVDNTQRKCWCAWRDAVWYHILSQSGVRGGTETNRQCFADICKSRQSRFGSKSRIYCRIDALKTINTVQKHLDNKHRQLILPICTRFIANLTLQTLADIGKALPISLCAAPKVCTDFSPAKLVKDIQQTINGCNLRLCSSLRWWHFNKPYIITISVPGQLPKFLMSGPRWL